jgi:hypothetical protein
MASMKPGWSKYTRSLSTTGASGPTARRAATMSSRYWRHPLYDEYAEVTNASARLTPSRCMVAKVSANIGSQLRLPQYTGRCGPWRSSSWRSAAISCRFCSLMGLTPPKSW